MTVVAQAVQQLCEQTHGCKGVLVLPLDVTSEPAKLTAAAEEADAAFDGAGVDYLVHNAGKELQPHDTSFYKHARTVSRGS